MGAVGELAARREGTLKELTSIFGWTPGDGIR